MDVLTLILACSVYPDDSLVRAMVDLASRGNASFVGDMTTLATFDETASSTAAEKLVRELDRQGGKPVLGLMGIPPGWAQRFGRSRKELYDGCVNVWVGTAVLASHYESCVAAHAVLFTPAKPHERRQRVAPPEAIRLCALRRYGADLGVDGYAETINRLLPQQRLLFSPGDAIVQAPHSPGRANASAGCCTCQEAFPVSTDGKPKRKGVFPTHLAPAPILD